MMSAVPVAELVREAWTGPSADHPGRQRRLWAEPVYVLVTTGLGLVSGAALVVALVLSAGLAVTAIGVPLLALTLVAARRLGELHRRLARRLLGEQIASPAAPPSVRGLYARIQARLADVPAWRAMAFVALQPPVVLVQFYVVLVTWGWGLVGLTYPIQHALGLNETAAFDSPRRQFLVALGGLALLLLAPRAVRLSTLPHRLLARWLLGPHTPSERIRTLEQTRARAVDDAVATLRTIERDLHDGAQARLVALTMQLTLVTEAIPAGPARELAVAARNTAREAIVELRELVRGLHPPVLDQGLDVALASLVAHSVIPVQLQVEPAVRPSPAIEAMAYFCAAELVTNAVRHSQASRITIKLVQDGGGLRLEVEDDGRGGADPSESGTGPGAGPGAGPGIGPGIGTGLAGLRRRVATVDGSLWIVSPPGGPTVVRVVLPSHA